MRWSFYLTYLLSTYNMSDLGQGVQNQGKLPALMEHI